MLASSSVGLVGVVCLLVGICPPGRGAAATSLRVGAFNIKTFGKKKMSDDVVARQIKEVGINRL